MKVHIFNHRTFIRFSDDAGNTIELCGDARENRGYGLNQLACNHASFLHNCSDAISDFVNEHLATK